MFFKNRHDDLTNTIAKYWDNNPNDIEKVALTCGVVIHKQGKGFSKEN